mgnify:CR=1 FL=1
MRPLVADPHSGPSCTPHLHPLNIIEAKRGVVPSPTKRVPPHTRVVPPPTKRVPPHTGVVPPPTKRVPPHTGVVPPPTKRVPPRTGAVTPPTNCVPPPTKRMPPCRGAVPAPRKRGCCRARRGIPVYEVPWRPSQHAPLDGRRTGKAPSPSKGALPEMSSTTLAAFSLKPDTAREPKLHCPASPACRSFRAAAPSKPSCSSLLQNG